MLTLFLAATLTLGAPPALKADTVITVEPGTRVSIRNFQGSITVQSWERDAVRVESDDGEGDKVEVEYADQALVVQALNFEGGGPEEIDLIVTVPVASPVSLQGTFGDMSVEGVEANVEVQAVEGDIRVRGGQGMISLHTVDGDVDLDGAQGKVEVASVDGDLDLTDVSGNISAATIDGDITLESIDATDVKATTVDGDILFRGALQAAGTYSLSTHEGDLTVTIPEDSNATVSVASFEGDFTSSFPITLPEDSQKRRFKFILGSGATRLNLQSFDGEIHLIRPGEAVREDH